MRKDDEPVPAQEGPQDTTESLGAVLRAARLSRQLSLEQLSEQLRIEPRALIALEEERFEALGAPVFVKGYLKLYGNSLGLDSRQLLETYRSRFGGAEPVAQARRPIGSDEARSFPMWVVPALAAAVFGAWWLVREPARDAALESIPPSAAASGLAEAPGAAEAPNGAAQSAEAPQGAPEPVEAAGAPIDAPGEPIDAAGGAAEPSRAPDMPAEPEGGAQPGGAAAPLAPTPAVVSTLGAEAAGLPQVSLVSFRVDEPAPAASVADAVPEPLAASAGGAEEMMIELRFIEDSWAAVTDARDARLYYGTGRAGAEARFTADTPVRVVLGNADGVVLEVDGQVFAYPAGSRRGNLARFTLSATE